MLPARPRRAGDSVEDFCRVCKTDRMHTVIVVDGIGAPQRVSCGYCGSEHNFRGGPRITAAGTVEPDGPQRAERRTMAVPVGPGAERRAVSPHAPGTPASRAGITSTNTADPQPAGRTTDMADHDRASLEALLRQIIREEAGLTPVAPAARWRGGTIVLRPGTAGAQEKTWPVDTFFHKVVMIRNRLRNLEQQVNASELPDDAKLKIQSYISGCYGTLTSFNLLFADEAEQFKGAGGD